ncbi:hypothetical protein PG988_013346 [Apiospora saccharicola]
MSGAKGTGTMKDSAEQPASEASVKPSSQLDSSIKDENPPTYGLTLVDRSIAINAKEEIQRNIDGSGDPHIPDAPGSVLHEMGEDPSERLPTEGSTSQRCEDIIPQSTVKLEPNLETASHSCFSAESESVSNCSFEETSPLPIDSNVRSAVSSWLASTREQVNSSAVIRAFEEVGDQELEDATSQQSRRKGKAPEIGTRAKKSHRSCGKQKASAPGTNHGESSSAELELASQLNDPQGQNQPFACPFFKKDRRLYWRCRNTQIKRINHLTEHLRNDHCRGYTCCRQCWIDFGELELLGSHGSSGT